MSLVEMSVSGAVMILVIAVVRAVALNKLPKRTFLALWGIALARLLLPYTLPSQVSVYSLWERLSAWMNPAEPQSGVRVYRMVGDAPVTTVGTAATAASAAPRVSETVTVDPWFAIWLVGVIICAAAMVETYVRCRREFRESLPVESDFVERWLREHPLRRRLSVRQSDRVSTPLTYGIIRPVILLPKNIDMSDEEMLRYVLTHELVHIRRFDAVSKLLLVAAVCVHWFNPLVWVMYVLANRDLEISCDEAVIRTLGGESKADYARALIRMEERRSGLSAFYNGFSKNATEERIVSIMKSKKTSVVAIFMAVALVLGTSAVLATSAAEPPDDITLADPGGVKKLTTPKVEWWTYDEYKEWLENEKVELQSMLGEKGWTQSRGDFVWTQEMIDESIAMYEQTLEDIKNGYLVSKTVDGSTDTMLMRGKDGVAVGTEIPPIDEYEPFGITLNEQEDALFYNGEKVKWFEDSVEVADGGVSSRCNYYRPDGTVSLRTVRESAKNEDGSTDSFGPIIRLEKLSDEEAEKRIAESRITLGQVATTEMEVIVSKGDEIATATDFMLPIEPEDKLVISNGFSAEHKGVDIAAPKGTLVFSVAKGRVTEVGFDETLGNFVKIEHENGYASTYAHLTDVEVEENATVDMGALIGKVGASGKATGANLHFELSVEGVPTDPESFYGLTADVEAGKLLEAYKAVGLEYKVGMDGTLSMSYKGKPVHSLYDPVTGVWFANNLNGSDLVDPIDLEAVYEDGKLVGLKETEANHEAQYAVKIDPSTDGLWTSVEIRNQTATASGDETSEGVPLPNMFDKYAPYGLVYEEKQTSSGTERNLSFNGKHVNHFADSDPNGGVFTFGSSTQTEDGITVHALYDNGEFVGVAEVVTCGYPMV